MPLNRDDIHLDLSRVELPRYIVREIEAAMRHGDMDSLDRVARRFGLTLHATNEGVRVEYFEPHRPRSLAERLREFFVHRDNNAEPRYSMEIVDEQSAVPAQQWGTVSPDEILSDIRRVIGPQSYSVDEIRAMEDLPPRPVGYVRSEPSVENTVEVEFHPEPIRSNGRINIDMRVDTRMVMASGLSERVLRNVLRESPYDRAAARRHTVIEDHVPNDWEG